MDAVAGCDSIGVSDNCTGLVGCNGKAARKHLERAHRLKRRYKPDIRLPFREQKVFFRCVQTLGQTVDIKPPVLKESRRALHDRPGRQLLQPRGEGVKVLSFRLFETVCERKKLRSDIRLLRYRDLSAV